MTGKTTSLFFSLCVLFFLCYRTPAAGQGRETERDQGRRQRTRKGNKIIFLLFYSFLFFSLSSVVSFYFLFLTFFFPAPTHPNHHIEKHKRKWNYYFVLVFRHVIVWQGLGAVEEKGIK